MSITTHAVFVSSTFSDLKDYRSRVRDVIQRLDAIDISMERIGAVDNRPLEECTRLIRDQSDLFVGIYAHRYGFIPEGDNVSITESEYNVATEKNIPRLIFIVDDNVEWRPAYIEDGEGKSKLQRFLDRLRANHVAERFNSKDDLGTRVAVSVGKALGQLSLTRASPQKNQQTNRLSSPLGSVPKTRADWFRLRESLYEASRNIFLAHTLRPSKISGQKFDVSIYLIRHKPKNASKPLDDVVWAEFFFGQHWNGSIFKRKNSGGLIGLVTAAHGPFLCTCKVRFEDGEEIFIHRYIDFEAGEIAR